MSPCVLRARFSTRSRKCWRRSTRSLTPRSSSNLPDAIRTIRTASPTLRLSDGKTLRVRERDIRSRHAKGKGDGKVLRHRIERPQIDQVRQKLVARRCAEVAEPDGAFDRPLRTHRHIHPADFFPKLAVRPLCVRFLE